MEQNNQQSAAEDQSATSPGVVYPSAQSSSEATKQKPPRKFNIFAGKGKYEILILLIIIVAVGAAAFYFGRQSKPDKPASVKQTTQVAVTSPNPTASAAPTLPEAQYLSSNVYLDSPQKLGDLGFLKNYKALGWGCDTSCTKEDLGINYYQIGSTAKGQKIIAMTYVAGPGGDNYLLAIENQPQIYSLLAQNSYDLANYDSQWQPSLNPNVTIDDKTKIDDIKMPLQLTVAGQKMEIRYAPDGATALPMGYMNLMKNGLVSIRGGYFDDVSPSAIKKLGSQGDIDYYEVTAKDYDNYKVVELNGTYKQLFSADYYPAGEIASATDNIKINWSSGQNNVSSYFSAGAGCGSTGYVVAKNIPPSDLIAVGKTPGGQTVYQLPQSNALVQETYDKDYAKGEFIVDQSLKNMSLDQFTKQHGYFLAKNGLGENVLFLRGDLIMRGGCAKPVIYLYPQHKQQVSVKVGAQVVNSLPAYNGGWSNVVASPDGSLSYKGKSYDSLFWDGYGYGAYPDIDSGVIVRTSDAVSTVRHQLVAQGLNNKEAADFIDYWQPKLKEIKQPYTRLTWFNTSQVNGLAPLQISPRPQTLIRVFLDFEGLDKPYDLKSQKLWAPARHGFTAVEWGGLARDGLN